MRLCVIESKQRFNAPETKQNQEECVMAPSRFSYIQAEHLGAEIPSLAGSVVQLERSDPAQNAQIQTTHLPRLFITTPASSFSCYYCFQTTNRKDRQKDPLLKWF